jgi:predicted ribosomally synthesized peptide with SipW-like signal peptide
MDELKKYLQNHEGKLDLDEPRPQVWQNIQRESQQVKKAPVVAMITRWAVAACVLALAGMGTWYVFSDKKTTAPQSIAKVEKTVPQTQPVADQKEPVVPEKIQQQETAKTEPRTKNNRTKNITQPINSKSDLGILHNIESSFTQVINLQRDRVSSMPMYAETPEYFNDFKIQIRQMEKDEKVIKSDIAKRGMNDVLLDQLINLYQQKLNTLKQLQIEMSKTNNRFKQNRGPVDSTKTYFLNL